MRDYQGISTLTNIRLSPYNVELNHKKYEQDDGFVNRTLTLYKHCHLCSIRFM